MKLYPVDLSPYAVRVRVQIYARGITDITFERSERMPAFGERLPIGRIPVLDVEGERREMVRSGAFDRFKAAAAAAEHQGGRRHAP